MHHPSSEAAAVGTSATVEEQLKQIDSMLRKYNIYDANDESDCDDLEDYLVAVISNSDSLREIEPVIIQIVFGNIETKALMASENVCTIINKS